MSGTLTCSCTLFWSSLNNERATLRWCMLIMFVTLILTFRHTWLVRRLISHEHYMITTRRQKSGVIVCCTGCTLGRESCWTCAVRATSGCDVSVITASLSWATTWTARPAELPETQSTRSIPALTSRSATLCCLVHSNCDHLSAIPGSVG